MTAPSNPKLRELLAKWIKHTKDKGLTEPTDADLKAFLIANNYDSDVVDKVVPSDNEAASKVKKPRAKRAQKANPTSSPPANSTPKNKKEEELTSEEDEVVDKVKNMIRNYPKKYLMLLKKELQS